MESISRISNLLSIVALLCCSSLLTVAHAASISNRNSGCSASATSLTPNQKDIKLAEKLAAYGEDKSSIPDFNLNKLTVNPQTAHLPCPRDHSDPQRWSSSAANIINVIPWKYIELMSNDHQRPIHPHITDAERCNTRIFRCPAGYEVFRQEDDTYHLEEQTTCTENSDVFDMKLVKYKAVTFYSCRQINPNPPPSGGGPPTEDS